MLDNLNLDSDFDELGSLGSEDAEDIVTVDDDIQNLEETAEMESDAEEQPKKRGRGRPKKDKPPKEPKKRGRPAKTPAAPEPDETFDTLKGLLSELQRDAEVIKLPISDIEIPDWKSTSRIDSKGGLKESVESLGLLTPIAVFYDEALDREIEETLDSDDDISDEDKPKVYTLLDGYRRILALQALEEDEVECYVWRLNLDSEHDLSDKLFILLYLLALTLNKPQRRTVKELYSLTQLFESSNLKLNTAELLLNMEAGTALQLKDVMTAEDFDDIREKLLNGDLTIEAAYKKLASARKKAEKERLAAERGDVDDVDSGPKKKGKKSKNQGDCESDASSGSDGDDVLANGEVPSQCRISDGTEEDDFADYVEPEEFQPVLKEISPEIQQFATDYIKQMLSEFGAELSDNKLYQNAIQATARLLAESQLDSPEFESEPAPVNDITADATVADDIGFVDAGSFESPGFEEEDEEDYESDEDFFQEDDYEDSDYF